MFQVMTQEGWIDVMQTAMNLNNSTIYRVLVSKFYITRLTKFCKTNLLKGIIILSCLCTVLNNLCKDTFN